MTIRISLAADGLQTPLQPPLSENIHHLQEIAESLRCARRCVVVTGAGISVSGGIPDFRSSDGLYNLVKNRYPHAVFKGNELFDASLFRDPLQTEIFYTFMGELKEIVSKANVTPTHQFLKRLDDQGKLLRCYTQNIDCLESRLPLSANLDDRSARIVQLHGDLDTVVCVICQSLYAFTEPMLDLFKNGSPPSCPKCEEMDNLRTASGKRSIKIGTLRPNIVLYNEFHAKGEKIADLTSYDLKRNPDMLIVMGTSLKVHGIKRLVRDLANSVHQKKKGKVILINRTELSAAEWGNVFDYHIQSDTDVAIHTIESVLQNIRASSGGKKLSRVKSLSDISLINEEYHPLQIPPKFEISEFFSAPVIKSTQKRQASIFSSSSSLDPMVSKAPKSSATKKVNSLSNKKLKKTNQTVDYPSVKLCFKVKTDDTGAANDPKASPDSVHPPPDIQQPVPARATRSAAIAASIAITKCSDSNKRTVKENPAVPSSVSSKQINSTLMDMYGLRIRKRESKAAFKQNEANKLLENNMGGLGWKRKPQEDEEDINIIDVSDEETIDSRLAVST